jgi:hypothetical protein
MLLCTARLSAPSLSLDLVISLCEIDAGTLEGWGEFRSILDSALVSRFQSVTCYR